MPDDDQGQSILPADDQSGGGDANQGIFPTGDQSSTGGAAGEWGRQSDE